MKNRNMCFCGLMSAFIILFSISMCGCTKIISTHCSCKPVNGDNGGYGVRKVWGYVFDDQDGDQQYDAGEGISGQQSKAYNQTSTYYDPNGRDSSGKYIITVTTPATYTVFASAGGYGTEEIPGIYVPTAATMFRGPDVLLNQ